MKKYYQLLLGLSAIFVGLLGISSRVRAVTHYVQSATPTIFVHGWGSSSHAEEKMANAVRDAGVTKTIVRANVDKKGKVTFNRPIPANAVNPIVEVNLEDNKLSAYRMKPSRASRPRNWSTEKMNRRMKNQTKSRLREVASRILTWQYTPYGRNHHPMRKCDTPERS